MKCTCGTEFQGRFCPHCGKPAETNNTYPNVENYPQYQQQYPNGGNYAQPQQYPNGGNYAQPQQYPNGGNYAQPQQYPNEGNYAQPQQYPNGGNYPQPQQYPNGENYAQPQQKGAKKQNGRVMTKTEKVSNGIVNFRRWCFIIAEFLFGMYCVFTFQIVSAACLLCAGVVDLPAVRKKYPEKEKLFITMSIVGWVFGILFFDASGLE